MDVGFVYASVFSGRATAGVLAPTILSLTAQSAGSCMAACKAQFGCEGFQFVPLNLLAVNARLQTSQKTPCILLNDLKGKVAADPLVVSGTVAPTPVIEDQRLLTHSFELDPSHPADDSVSSGDGDGGEGRNGEKGKEDAEGSGDKNANNNGGKGESGEEASPTNSSPTNSSPTACVSSGKTYEFDVGKSYQGPLLETDNVVRGVETAEECRTFCEAQDACEAFSFGAGWQGCYLMQKVTGSLEDKDVVSGYAKCDANAGGQTQRRRLQAAGSTPSLAGSATRSLDECTNAKKGVLYTEGDIIESVPSADAGECFARCRATPSCFFMTYYDVKAADKRRKLQDEQAGRAQKMASENRRFEAEIRKLLYDENASYPEDTMHIMNKAAPEAGADSPILEDGGDSPILEKGGDSPILGGDSPILGGESGDAAAASCVLLREVTEQQTTRASLSHSASAHCDAVGDQHFAPSSVFDVIPKNIRKVAYPITLGVASGSALLVLTSYGITRRRRQLKAKAESGGGATNGGDRRVRVTHVSIQPTDVLLQPGEESTQRIIDKRPLEWDGAADDGQSEISTATRNDFGMASPTLRASPLARHNDFATLEAKSTGKRLKRNF